VDIVLIYNCLQVNEQEDISLASRLKVFWTLTCIDVRRPHTLGEWWWIMDVLVTATTPNAFPVCSTTTCCQSFQPF